MTKTFCDFCGKEIPSAGQQTDAVVKANCPERVLFSKNLCPVCAQKVIGFFEGKGVGR